jgi:hypothetical protein
MIEFIFTLPTTIGHILINLAIWGGLGYVTVEFIINELKNRGVL